MDTQTNNNNKLENNKLEQRSTTNSFPISGYSLEKFVWLLLAIAVVIYPFADTIRFAAYEAPLAPSFSYYLQYFIASHFMFIILSLLVFLFPYIFRLTFGAYPFMYLRFRQYKSKHYSHHLNLDSVIVESSVKKESLQGVQEMSGVNYAGNCIEESKQIAEKIYTRSGVYLLAGVIIAFTGIGIFYSSFFAKSNASSTSAAQMLLEYLPRFGALFFIEFIAFFFLKQFRVMHEEYRYYEAIKRKRQDLYGQILLLQQFKDNPDLSKQILDKFADPKTIGNLNKDETTQILEAQKILNQDMDVFSKLIELVKEVKTK
jgi:hypothetical protein